MHEFIHLFIDRFNWNFLYMACVGCSDRLMVDLGVDVEIRNCVCSVNGVYIESLLH